MEGGKPLWKRDIACCWGTMSCGSCRYAPSRDTQTGYAPWTSQATASGPTFFLCIFCLASFVCLFQCLCLYPLFVRIYACVCVCVNVRALFVLFQGVCISVCVCVGVQLSLSVLIPNGALVLLPAKEKQVTAMCDLPTLFSSFLRNGTFLCVCCCFSVYVLVNVDCPCTCVYVCALMVCMYECML